LRLLCTIIAKSGRNEISNCLIFGIFLNWVEFTSALEFTFSI